MVLAYRRGTDAERAFWRRNLEELDQTDDALGEAIRLMTKHNALTDSVERARHYGAIARDAIGIFGDHPAKKVLIDLVDFCVERGY